MKKIAILTLNDNNNYGNRLQNYASQEILKRFGYDVETVTNNTIDRKSRNFKYYIKLFSIKKVLEKVNIVFNKKILSKLKNNVELINKRKEKFIEFNKNINISDYIINDNKNLSDLEKRFNYFVVGSDQVWNPFSQLLKSINFVMFSPKHKNISLSASFGVSDIPIEMVSIYKKGLQNFQSISVREEQGQKIVKEIADVESIVLIDPTMLLTKEEWNKISKRPDYFPNKKYILTCFLGKFSKKRKKIFEKIKRDNNLEIVNLNQIKDRNYFSIGPSEFIYMVKNASIVFTDSFHVCVFAILFNKPFYVFDRESASINMNSRLDTLLSKFKFENRKLSEFEEISFECDFSHCNKILEKEKIKFMEFLKKALNEEED